MESFVRKSFFSPLLALAMSQLGMGGGGAFNVHCHNLCSFGLKMLVRQDLCVVSVPRLVELRGAIFTSGVGPDLETLDKWHRCVLWSSLLKNKTLFPSKCSGGWVDMVWSNQVEETTPESLCLPPSHPFLCLFPQSFPMLLAEIQSARVKAQSVCRGRNPNFCNS